MLAYGAWLLWLLAGLGDFLCHRHTDLPRTSGLAESGLHLLQLVLIGGGVVAALALEPSGPLAVALGIAVAAHAVFGYLDTKSAFPRRTILPVEQHIHSVLDMAPPIAFSLWLAAHWAVVQDGGALALRQPALPVSLWVAVLAPAVLLCGLPAVLEFRAAWACRRERGAETGAAGRPGISG